MVLVVGTTSPIRILSFLHLLQQTNLLDYIIFKQAEKILVEEDAVVIPLYYYNQKIVTKPYLHRNFGIVDPDLANWTTEFVQTEIAADIGGSLMSEDGKVLIEIPPFTFAEDIR